MNTSPAFQFSTHLRLGDSPRIHWFQRLANLIFRGGKTNSEGKKYALTWTQFFFFFFFFFTLSLLGSTDFRDGPIWFSEEEKQIQRGKNTLKFVPDPDLDPILLFFLLFLYFYFESPRIHWFRRRANLIFRGGGKKFTGKKNTLKFVPDPIWTQFYFFCFSFSFFLIFYVE